jgi:phosphoesterase RecJ-like protein
VLHNEDATVLMGSYLEGLTAPDGFAPDTVVSTDVATENLLPDSGRIDLAIDHHPSQEFFAKETCLEADKAACGEIIWRICGELGTMDGEIAVPLYVAIATDCGCFVYANTTPHTHRAAAALMEQGIDFQALNKRHFRTKSVARMKLESLIIEHMHLYHNGTVAVAPISLELIARAGATSEDTDDIAAFLGQLKGVLHTATVREHEGGECRVSVRTKADELNATRVCARLGGGGHKAASGCTIKGTVEEAERAILAAIDDQLAQPSQD